MSALVWHCPKNDGWLTCGQSTAYLITKVSDPPPPPSESQGFAASQTEWRNKQKFLSLSLANLDALHDKPPPYSEVDPHPVSSQQ